MQLKQFLQNTKFDSVIPIALIVAVNFIAFINVECCIIVFLVLPVVVSSYYIYCAKKSARTNFFCVFAISSGIYLLGLFEFFVPLLELLPQENFVFISLIFVAVSCFYKTYQRSSLNRLGHTEIIAKQDDQVTLLVADDKALESDNESDPGDRNSCSSCRKYIPARTFHCMSCKGCVIGRDHHQLFLNCCIGRFNHKYFYAGCIACFSALILFANLSLTSICHPFPIFMVMGVNVLLPDDCAGVFTEAEYALCFVGAIYALELAIALLFVIVQQTFLITKGVTSTEYYLRGEKHSRNHCLRNWRNFCIWI